MALMLLVVLIALVSVVVELPCLVLAFPYSSASSSKLDSSKSSSSGSAPVELYEELGCSPTLSTIVSLLSLGGGGGGPPQPLSLLNTKNGIQQQLRQQPLVYFDPLRLATDENFSRYREAELKHSRVSMLAMVGIVASPWNFYVGASSSSSSPTPGVWDMETTGTTSFSSSSSLSELAASLWASTTKDENPSSFHWNDNLQDLFGSLFSSSSSPFSFSSSSSLSLHWDNLSLAHVFQVLLVCGILESKILVPQDPKDIPGDYGIGYFGIRDKGRHERSLLVELEHGRLSMMAFLYWLVILDPPSPVAAVIANLLGGVGGGDTGSGGVLSSETNSDSLISVGQEIVQSVLDISETL